jgi:hypothetical protein
MRCTAFSTLILAMAAMVHAGVVVTPIRSNQVVAKVDGDCAFGVVTPNGCGPLRA